MDWVYLITAVSALAEFHQPVVFHSPVRGEYHRCSAPIPARAAARYPACGSWLTDLIIGARHSQVTGPRPDAAATRGSASGSLRPGPAVFPRGPVLRAVTK